jgi:hypothetical protein
LIVGLFGHPLPTAAGRDHSHSSADAAAAFDAAAVEIITTAFDDAFNELGLEADPKARWSPGRS